MPKDGRGGKRRIPIDKTLTPKQARSTSFEYSGVDIPARVIELVWKRLGVDIPKEIDILDNAYHHTVLEHPNEFEGRNYAWNRWKDTVKNYDAILYDKEQKSILFVKEYGNRVVMIAIGIDKNKNYPGVRSFYKTGMFADATGY